MITADDVSALVVLADRAPQFQHHLKRNFVDIRWVLDHDTDGTERPSMVERVVGSPAKVLKQQRRLAHAQTPTAGSVREAESSAVATPSSRTPEPSSTATTKAHEESKSGRVVRAEDDNDDEKDPAARADNDHLAPQTPERRPPSTSKNDSNATSPASTAGGGGRRAQPQIRTLETLNCAVAAEDLGKGSPPLITTPRSALVLLRNGFGVSDILAPPAKQIKSKAQLEGAKKEAVALRISADARRRELRREMMMVEYRRLASSVPRDAIVEAMREHYYASRREDRDNVVANQSELQPLVPVTTGTQALIDEDAVEALRRAREHAAVEMSRIVDQTERQRSAALASEEQLLEQQHLLAGEAKKSNVHRDRLIAAKRAALKAKQEQAMAKSTRLLEAERSKGEARRAELVTVRSVVEDRAEHKRSLARTATRAAVKAQVHRREVVRDKEREMLEERRGVIESKAAFKHLLHQRTVEQRDQALAERRKENEERDRQRQEQLVAMAEERTQRRQDELDRMVEHAEQRSKEIAEARAARREAKRQRAQAKKERIDTTLAVRRENEQQRVAEYDRALAEKEIAMQRAEAERKRQVVVANEAKALARLEREEEQQRAKSVAEYRYVGYVSANLHKGEQMERDAHRRKVLASQLRQEREAIARSKDDMLHELDDYERAERRRLELQYR